MKRQVLACGWVMLLLFLLFCWDWSGRAVERIYSPFSPFGFRVSYFSDPELKVKRCVRSERSAIKEYGDLAPAFGVPSQNYSARWEGWLEIREHADYAFFLQSMGGTRLFLDDLKIIDKWNDHNWMPGVHASTHLDAGVHKVAIEYWKETGRGALRLSWAGGSVPANTIMGSPHVRKTNEDIR